ncbi:GIY-YIG nuclease family protein [Chryseobacterium sp. RP-3-3]|uniref:GIY-YIG nuclease family protein n=1 Tax=Chryseobacterium antibioticum TaxID=2728847 RepID=A0A7Y0FTI3_9FLAO|nr:GIY-YIG nuclease family protein [Chryseobacterium antibioticum]NML71686.1 GIY-YIG nuclease family protein [Chryseobacterium antibioticum]
MNILTKFCTKCKTEKPIYDFAISKITKSGRRHRCTSCRNARRRETYKNPELRNWNKVWTFDKCKKEALKYTNRTDFVHYSSSAYHRAIIDGFLDQICSHMISRRKPYRFWNFDQCQKEALKYTTKVHFKRDNSSAYSISLRKGWLALICSHMHAVGNQNKRLVYAYEFPNNAVYVGLTCNKEGRQAQHLKEKTSPVYNYSLKNNLNPVYKSISKSYIAADKAQKLEEKTIKIYKQNGWIILNKAKAGGLGWSEKKWTFEKCQKEALKYKTRSDFQDNSSSAYNAAHRNNWMQICDHMIYKRSPKGTWTYESCKQAALQCKTRSEFRSRFGGALSKASAEGFYEEIVSHLKKWENRTKSI